jgi:hypothetical protein
MGLKYVLLKGRERYVHHRLIELLIRCSIDLFVFDRAFFLKNQYHEQESRELPFPEGSDIEKFQQ